MSDGKSVERRPASREWQLTPDDRVARRAVAD